MHSGRTLTVGLAVALIMLLATLSGCKKKQPPVPQPQTQAPTISVPAQQPPATQPTEPQTQPQPAQPPAQQQPQQKTATVTKPKPKPTKKKPSATAKKPAPKPPEHKTVPNGGSDTNNAQLAASIPQGEAVHQRQSAAQLRINTEKNLVNLTRTLSDDEQLTVQQIRAFLTQSRTADNEGDTERAYTLALKAYLLSDDLTKR